MWIFFFFFCVQLTYFDRNSNQFFILEIFVYRKEDQNRQNLANEGLDQILLVTFYIVKYSFQTVEI